MSAAPTNQNAAERVEEPASKGRKIKLHRVKESDEAMKSRLETAEGKAAEAELALQAANDKLKQAELLVGEGIVTQLQLLAGAQDLGTLWAPARTQTTEGVRNEDWLFPLGADGYGVAFDPSDANTMYMMTQQGNLQRVDRVSGEITAIQPQPAPGDAPPAHEAPSRRRSSDQTARCRNSATTVKVTTGETRPGSR